MGATASAAKVAVISQFKEKEPPFDKILLKILVKNVPNHFHEIDAAKVDFVDFCRKILIPRRENVLNELTKSLQCSVDKVNKKYLIDMSKIVSYVIKIIVFLTLIFNLFGLRFCVTLFSTSLTIDIGLYMYLRSERQLAKERCLSLIRTVEADREYIATARTLLNEFRKRFFNLETEIADFTREVNMKFLDVKCNVPEVKRFLRQIQHLKPDVKNDMNEFVKAFVDLIDDCIAMEYVHDPEQDAESAETYVRFMQRCQETFENAEILIDDLDLCYLNLDLTDSTNLGMLIISKDLESSSFDKINQMRQSLHEELTRLKESIILGKKKNACAPCTP